MPEPEFLPLEDLGSVRDLPLHEQAGCLLKIVAQMFHAMQDGSLDSVAHAVQLHGAKQTFRDCVESLCRPLTPDEIQQLFVLTVISICEQVVNANSSAHD